MGKRKKGEEEQQAAERIPSDLLPEVLARVPYRSLCRFKCVSTPGWRSVPTPPSAGGRRRPSPASSATRVSTVSAAGATRASASSTCPGGAGRWSTHPSLPFLGDYEEVRLLNCCGGILLCQGWNRTMEVPE
ncbi:hypothetical protein VPH35_017449 [Triticum aestivum]